ncbi:MAG: RNA 2',3'-cyclic phosphodiesterase [Candidatus Aminicenantes bacterium]|nr:RNA 2',3'-cyclic phosphodiesterase [Candidatus Aminicenantes bacterium]
MRMFTGIALSEDAREKVLRELKPFRKAGTPIHWTDERNIHLTLKFIGEIDDAQVPEVAAALLAHSPATAPFRLSLRGFGKFPAGDELHVFWAGVEECPPLHALYSSVEDALAPLGIARETRPFHPHLTLGRNRARYNFKGLFARLAECEGRFLAEWTVSAFQLFASRLTASGPIHTILKEISLAQS